MELLRRLVAQRRALQERIDEIIGRADAEERTTFDDAEETELRQLLTDARSLDERIAELEENERGTQAAAEAARRVEGEGRVRVNREPLTYERANPRRSFFLDLARATVHGDQTARDRLERHRREVAVELAEVDEERSRRFAAFLEAEGGHVERRDLDRVDGAGGEFVPPMWLMEEYAELARAGRPFANLVRQVPLPAGTDQINVPKITGGTAVGVQTADNEAVTETDMTTGVAQAPVRTIAGQQDVALQLLDQSPIAFDEIVFADLIADYNAKLDAQLLNGSGSSGQLKGILNATGLVTVTYTDADPTVPELYPKIADGIQQAGTNRKLPPTVVLMHLRRWSWHTAALDSQNRPLVPPVSPVSVGPQNALALQDALQVGGPVGVLQGVRTVVDLHIPTNLGGGTNEDRIIITRAFDHVLFEGSLRTRVLPEVLSGNLTVRLQVYAYAAFTAERYPAGIAVVAGTGLATPTF